MIAGHKTLKLQNGHVQLMLLSNATLSFDNALILFEIIPKMEPPFTEAIPSFDRFVEELCAMILHTEFKCNTVLNPRRLLHSDVSRKGQV